MKRFKLGLVLLAFITMTGIANAGGVGYIDYVKVIDNYDYAKKAIKEVDAKGLEMQQYLVDKEKETARLNKELAAVEKDIKIISGKLNNQGFVAKAPAAVVEAERAKLASAKEKLAATQAALSKLG